MSVSTGENESDLLERIVKIEEISTEVRGGHDVLVVKDSAGNEYSTIDSQKHKEYTEESDEYEGEVCKILFSITRQGYLNFYHVLEKVDENPVEEEIDPDEYEITQELDDTDRRITRQSAGHDASRIVQGMIESSKDFFGDPRSDEFERQVKDEIQNWTNFFKRYYRTGDWGGQENGQ